MFTVMVCWAWGAGWYLSLPSWLASMTHVPGAVYLTVVPLVPDTLHTPVLLAGSSDVLEGSTENTTGLPDLPPVADKVAGVPTQPAG